MEYLFLILYLAGIVFGADHLVGGAVSVARRFRVSDFVIGAAIVGVGTSMPELTVSFLGALKGNPDVAIGNVVGSNIFNVLGILGLTAVLCPIVIDRRNLKFEIPLCTGVSILLTLLAFNFFNGSNPSVGRVDGILLLARFAAFMWVSFTRDRKDISLTVERVAETVPLWKSLVRVVGGLVLLIASCDLFVDNAVSIAKSLGVNDAYISLTLIACGTSLPELAASLAAAFKKHTDLALGNIIGSNIFNITLILGLSSQAAPLTTTGITLLDYLVMIAAVLLVLVYGLRGTIGRVSGVLMLAFFCIYNWYLSTSHLA